MNRYFLIPLLFLITSCHTVNYYIVRHAEKANTNTMSSDVPLSDKGSGRAMALGEKLVSKGVTEIFSTPFRRTVSTAEPLSKRTRVTIQFYFIDTLSGFVSRLRKMHQGNALIVGHSNTVDYIVNELAGKNYLSGDLPDTAYGDLFIVEKRGHKYTFRRDRFGQ